MKKFIIILLMLLTSCGHDPGVVTKTEAPAMRVSEYTYNGHRYLLFRAENDSEISGVVHDPDCPVCRKNIEEK